MTTTEKTKLPHAKNLTKQSPRSPKERLGGYALMARMIDKGRAHLNGTIGEYHFDCPLDNMLFSFKGVKGADVRELLSTGADDGKIVGWFNAHGAPKTPEEIKAWSDGLMSVTPYTDPGKKEFFIAECKKLGLDPEETTLFQWLDADDKASFKR
jgi:hypothetical protein